jgi:putative holliday junction resolvase
MTEILALDVGEKRVGVARLAKGATIPFPIATWPRAQGRAEALLQEYLQTTTVELLVVGLPVDGKGLHTPQCDNVLKFTRRLERRLSVPIELVDEYLSSAVARDRLGIGERPSQEQRESGVIDSMAAVIILETYLQKAASKPSTD